MYPLYQNQKPYFWENEKGKRLLVWNGEHYNLGNALGIVFNRSLNFMTENYFGKSSDKQPLQQLYQNLSKSIAEYEENGYPYDFYITSVSGVFSDNAPVYHGAINDWWGNGIGSTPYAVKHYKEALRLSHVCDRLEEKTGVHHERLVQTTQDNALLYAEHTWGHSATITNPYDTMVANLDIRKTGYASKAHEAAAMRKSEQCHLLGDILRYYNLSGTVKAVSMSRQRRVLPVEFYVETGSLKGVRVKDQKTGKELSVQLSAHPRGILVSFLTEFEPLEEKLFTYEEQPAKEEKLFTRTAWVGAERVRDIVNEYDTESYQLPYGLENDWFKLSYKIGEGITSFYNKKSNVEMLKEGLECFFTPIYERTEIRKGIYEERRLIGRNVRGLHAKQYQGRLTDIQLLDHGPVFNRVKLTFELEGTYHCDMVIKMYRKLPRMEFTCRIAKNTWESWSIIPFCYVIIRQKIISVPYTAGS